MKKNLKERYLELEAKQWGNDAKMMKYHEKNFLNGVDLKDGMIVFDKPRIEKHYCYSYDEFQPDTVHFAQSCCENVRNNFNVFLNTNLKNINRWIAFFQEKIEEKNQGNEKVWIIDRYCKNNEYTRLLKTWTNDNDDDIKFRFAEGYRVAEVDELKKILRAYKEMKEYMTKKCKTYWKRFGGTKLRAWTYSMWD